MVSERQIGSNSSIDVLYARARKLGSMPNFRKLSLVLANFQFFLWFLYFGESFFGVI